ncbi:hypothetical protein ACHAW6_007175 [Cyclotella cf. meneghiniana]
MVTVDIDSTACVAPPRHRRRTNRNVRASCNVSDSSRSDFRAEKPGPIMALFEGRSWVTTACLIVALTLTISSSLHSLSSYSTFYGSRRRLVRTASVEQQHELNDNEGELASLETDSATLVDRMTPQEIEQNLELNRVLIEGMDDTEIEGVTALPPTIDQGLDERGEDAQGGTSSFVAQQTFNTSQESTPTNTANNIKTDYESLISNSNSLPTYDLPALLSQINLFTNTFAILIYDPPTDAFYALYSKKHYWASSVEKLIRSLYSVTYLIRNIFGDRLNNQELAIAISAGDYPAVKITDCVRLRSRTAPPTETRRIKTFASNGCSLQNAAPILHFGSTFRHQVFQNMISMPMPEPHHLKCFEEWASHRQVCAQRKRIARIGENGLFGEGVKFDWTAADWDGLIPQVVWRGTDFVYLQTLYPELGRPSLDSHIAPHLDRLSTINLKQQALEALKKSKAGLVPRWKAVLHTAQAELDVQQNIEKMGRNEHEKRRMKEKILPWANIKFSHYVSEKGIKAPTKGSKEYKMWERMDFPAVGESLSMEDLAKYRYHIDLGGGGGTTWSGTIQKLALPGVLFHHVTPTKDYIHDYMKPWKHYIPVAPDLRDLKEKFDWAEAHPNQARKIARQATKLVRYLSSSKGMEETFHKDFVEPMRAVLDAYVPVSKTEYRGNTWRKVIMEIQGQGNMLPILKCTGKSVNSCERMVGKGGFYDPAQIRRLENDGAGGSGV